MIRTGQLSNHAVGGRGAQTVTTRPAATTAPAGSRAPLVIVDLETHSEPTVSPAALASYWRVSVRTIYRDIDKGALPAFRLPGGTLRIKIVDARSYGRPVE